MTADSNSLVSYARNAAQTHLTSYNEEMPVEQLVKRVCDLKQGYTQFGGALTRPIDLLCTSITGSVGHMHNRPATIRCRVLVRWPRPSLRVSTLRY
jgi:hypothetical protein